MLHDIQEACLMFCVKLSAQAWSAVLEAVGEKKLVSWFKLDIASFSYLASCAAGHPRLSGGQGVRQVFICCPVPPSTLPLSSVTATELGSWKCPAQCCLPSPIPASYPSLNRSTLILEDHLLCSPKWWEQTETDTHQVWSPVTGHRKNQQNPLSAPTVCGQTVMWSLEG